jgi:trehalose/maltose hydrolase-like predicted phosphorylase
MVALESDVGDVQGGTTAEGIHMGVMSGTLDLLQRSYLGEVIRDGVLSFAPKAMDQLRDLTLPLRFRGLPLEVALESDKLRISAAVDSLNLNRSERVSVGAQQRKIRSGGTQSFALEHHSENGTRPA